MEDREFQIASGLIGEVLDWLEADNLLRPVEVGSEIVLYAGSSAEIRGEFAEVGEYDDAVDVNYDDTPYLDLQDLLVQIRTYYEGVRSWDPDEQADRLVRNAAESMTNIVGDSDRVMELAQKVYAEDASIGDLEETHYQIMSTIWEHFESLIAARMLTLSRRYAPVEAVFTAYRLGLFPWGWDYETDSILCLRP